MRGIRGVLFDFARNLIVDSYVEMMTHDLFLETSDVLESDESDENENLRS